MFDVFYSGPKPNLFAHEQPARDVEHARELSRTRYFWWVNYLTDYSGWDFLWEPVPWEDGQRHAWPSQHQPDSGTYLVPKQGYTETNYHTDRYLHHLPDMSCWHMPEYIDPTSIDPRWSPDPMDPPYIYEFPVEWGWNCIGGPEYRVAGATERKYVYDFITRTLPDPTRFTLSDKLDPTDPVFRWRPNPTELPYIYVFGNQWYPAEIRESARYTVPGATQVKYVDDIRCTRLPDTSKFVKLYDCDFDCSWEPDPGSPPYTYVFGNQYYSAEVMPTVEYHMPGATERKYMDIPAQLLPDASGPWKILHACEWDYTWRPEPGSPPYIYVFGNQWWTAEKMPTVEYHMPGATERKYMPGPVATLPVNMTLWHIPKDVDTRDMDFSWVPDPGEPSYIYQFATQHQKTGGPQYRVPGATEIKYLDMMRAEVSTEAVPIFEIDHLDGNAGHIPNTVRRVRYFDNYRDTLIRLAKNLRGKYEHVWVCSSICDYTNFDFSWHPETWQSTMLHVFASDGEKFGDTFYMHVPTFAERAERKELLEWYSVNYVPRRSVPRRPLPVVQHNMDTHVEAVKTMTWSGPLALFTTAKAPANLPTVPLWREKTRTIVPLDAGAESVIVPRDAIACIDTQLYDYAHIDKTQRHGLCNLQDVIFISNGESMAEDNWQHLKTICPRARRSDGVTGREAAYKAAAMLSETPWFFAVFAKTEVLPTFGFDYAPDRMQQPKHYIFHSRNPVNGLEYGAMNINLYNRQLVLNTVPGLDFTLSAAHEVVPICASISRFNTDPWVTWRSAFREVLKLKREVDLGADVEIQHRLRVWTTQATGQNAEHCLQGAQDALVYYEKTQGRLEDLQLSFDWAWLQDYYYSLYQQQPWLESI